MHKIKNKNVIKRKTTLKMNNNIDFEALYLDEDDKKHLESISKIEREKILDKRYREVMEIEKRKTMNKSNNEKQSLKTRVVEFENVNFVVKKNMLFENLYKSTLNKIKGCFVKAKLGNKYCVCKVLNIIEGEPYNIDLASKNVLKTCFYLTIDSGNRVYNNFKIINISNRELTEDEFNEFVNTFEITNVEAIINKYKSFEKEMKRSLKDNEILEMISIKNRMNPRKISNTEKLMDLICCRNKAIEIKDKVNALKYQKMIIAIEEEEKANSIQKEKQ